MALNKILSVLTDLRPEQVSKFFENLSKQLNCPLNISRLKTGVIEGRALGIDDAGNFIVAQANRMKNGDIATVCNFGTRMGVGSKVVPAPAATTDRGLLESLATQFRAAGHNINIDRMKTGVVGGNLVGIDDTGRYIQTTFTEKLKDGSYGTVSTYGKVENACSKIVPNQALSTIRITHLG